MDQHTTFNYELSDPKTCESCKYRHWREEGKQYGCPAEPWEKVCGSYVRNGEEFVLHTAK